MKIEIMNINFALKKLQHISSAGMNEIKMKNAKVESMSPLLAYIEEYAEKNGFEVLNGVTSGSATQLFLIKK